MARACPVCGSRRWRRDNVTGSAVCEDGHVYQDFRIENSEADEPNRHALHRRKITSTRRAAKVERSGKNQEYYEGDDAEYLRLQALQLLLRVQVQALRKLWNLPDVFEMIVKDLWTYQLAISILPPPPDDPNHNPSPQFGAPVSTAIGSGSQSLEDRMEADDDKSDTDSEADDKAGSDESDKEDDPEIDLELLEEMSRLSELSDKEEENRVGRGAAAGRIKGRRKRRLKVSDTLIVLLLGLWIVRKGVMCIDIENLVNGNIIPYLDFAHSNLLLTGMTKHMNRNVIQSLSPNRSPSPKYIFASLRLFGRILNTDFGIPIPEFNLPIISWRIISGLGGTPVTYSQVTRLLNLVDISTSLLQTSTTIHKRKPMRPWRGSRRSSTRGPSRTQSRGRSAGRKAKSDNDDGGDADGSEEGVVAEVAMMLYRRSDRRRDVTMPELAVVAAWVVVMKLSYGLEGVDRRAGDAHDPIVGLPDGRTWIEELERRMREGALSSQRNELEKRNFSSLPLDDIDGYLNLAEDLLLKDREPPPDSDTMTFPLLPSTPIAPPLPPPTSYRHFHTALPIITSTRVPLVPGTGIPPEPGEEVRSYDPKDTQGTLPRMYDVVIRAAAQMVGMGIVDVADVVQIIERRLEKARKERRISLRGKWGPGRGKDQRSKSRSRAQGAGMGQGGEFEIDDDDGDGDEDLSGESDIEEDE